MDPSLDLSGSLFRKSTSSYQEFLKFRSEFFQWKISCLGPRVFPVHRSSFPVGLGAGGGLLSGPVWNTRPAKELTKYTAAKAAIISEYLEPLRSELLSFVVSILFSFKIGLK